MAVFETSDEHSDPVLRPMRVAVRREDVFSEVKDMVADLRGWSVAREDAERFELECERAGSALGGRARVLVRVEGPEGIPSATVNVRCETFGPLAGLFGSSKQVAREFLEPFRRRVG